jgi:uncharacterized protein (TIGR02466 family)
MGIVQAFATQILHESKWLEPRLRRELLRQSLILREIDQDGQSWSRRHYKNGFTSYGSQDDLHRRFPDFSDLAGQIEKRARLYSRRLEWDLEGGRLSVSSMWVNIMPHSTVHSLHLHPLSSISGTVYLQVPLGSAPIRFEDPRLGFMMACPPKRATARSKPNLSLSPKAGDLVLFESWLRHEVPMSDFAARSKGERISVSFNLDWSSPS